jgi:type VII secretion protein EccB
VSRTSSADAPARRGGLGTLRAPATRDQVDAYRFGLRRMEAALVRGDPVPLHEQIRSQRRAALAGVVLGLLGLCGAAVWAVVQPSPEWQHEAVVVGATSGAMYAVAHGPDRLVPVADLPAARLVLAALRTGGSAAADPGSATATVVPDASIAEAPRTPAAAVPGAVAVTPEATIRADWALCDTVDPEGALVGTTVIGAAAGRPPVASGDGVLLGGPGDTTWLVTGGSRHRVDVGDGAVRAAFRLTKQLPRASSAALISVLPEGPALATPVVPDRGDPAPPGLPGRVGDVLGSGVGDGQEYFVVLDGGLQEVPPAVADLLVVASDARQVTPVGADVLSGATFVDTLRVDGWPVGPVRVAEPGDAPVTCWTWTPDHVQGDVWFGRDLPLAADVAPVGLAQADGPGERLDAVDVGAGGAVRATGPGRAAGAGPLWLVSATGVGYGVASDPTAAALGITSAEPAPEAVLRLLPTGKTLDLADASRATDVLDGA